MLAAARAFWHLQVSDFGHVGRVWTSCNGCGLQISLLLSQPRCLTRGPSSGRGSVDTTLGTGSAQTHTLRLLAVGEWPPPLSPGSRSTDTCMQHLKPFPSDPLPGEGAVSFPAPRASSSHSSARAAGWRREGDVLTTSDLVKRLQLFISNPNFLRNQGAHVCASLGVRFRGRLRPGDPRPVLIPSRMQVYAYIQTHLWISYLLKKSISHGDDV